MIYVEFMWEMSMPKKLKKPLIENIVTIGVSSEDGSKCYFSN